MKGECRYHIWEMLCQRMFGTPQLFRVLMGKLNKHAEDKGFEDCYIDKHQDQEIFWAENKRRHIKWTCITVLSYSPSHQHPLMTTDKQNTGLDRSFIRANMAISMYVWTCSPSIGICKNWGSAVEPCWKTNTARLFTAVSATLTCVGVERFSTFF